MSHITDTDYILVMATKLEVRKSIYRQAVLLGYPEARLLFIHNDVAYTPFDGHYKRMVK